MKIIKKAIKEFKEVNSLLKQIETDSKEISDSMKINGFILDKFRDGGLRVRTYDAKDN